MASRDHVSAEQDDAPRIYIMLRPLGSPLPLGFFAFGLGSILTGALQLGWIPQEQTKLVALIGLCFVAPLELIAGLFAYLARDAGAATTLSLFAGSWVALSIAQLTGQPGQTTEALGIVFLALCAVLVALAAASFKAKPLFGVLLVVAIARFLAEAVHQLGGHPIGMRVAGWIGVGVAAVALYGGLALLLEDSQLETKLPTGRRGKAEQALRDGFEKQVEKIEREAGIRNQL